MEKIKNCYEILGITSEQINWILYQKDNGEFELKTREEEQKDKIIKQSYDYRINVLQYGLKSNINNPKKVEEIKKNIEKLKRAYETVKNESLRTIYNEELIRRERKKERPLIIEETAYDFFGISEMNIKNYPVNKANFLIETTYKKIVEKCNRALSTNEIDFKQKEKVEYILKKAEAYYNLINTPEKRKIYGEVLDKKEKEVKDKQNKEYIKMKYSKINYFNKDLINTDSAGKEKVARKETKKAPYIILKNEGRIFLRKTAEIVYENCTEALESYINEYEVIRTINGEEKTDRIYTNLALPELEVNETTGKPVNPEYYDCVVNNLLSEDMIEASKYNCGYIGQIKKDKNGKYNTTLGEEELNPIEQEMMTAVIISNKQLNKRNKREKDEEGR